MSIPIASKEPRIVELARLAAAETTKNVLKRVDQAPRSCPRAINGLEFVIDQENLRAVVYIDGERYFATLTKG